ncbi:MAG: hypothetical protein QME94_08920 [Anaerolineae bacterium]|nr:hypothetical protein [Anaerolineae bacterium]
MRRAEDAAAGEPTVVTTTAGTGRLRVRGTLVATGAGLVISLTGGERPHVGAVGLGVPHPSRRHPGRTSASSSVLTLSGHRDDELAKPLAEEAARRVGEAAVVVVGLHVDEASAEEIAGLIENARQAFEHLLVSVRGEQT